VQTKVSALIAASATAAALALPALGAHSSGGDAYVVTLSGSQQSLAKRSGTVRDDLGCRYRVNDVDRQVLTFSAQKRLRLVLRPGGTLPQIRFNARVAVAGSRHRESELTEGDPTVCDPSQTPRTTKCASRVLRAALTLRSAGRGRIVLDGRLAGNSNGLACETTLTKPDRFLVRSESELTIPSGAFGGLFAKDQFHSTSTGGDGVAKTTDVRWTVALNRVP
jgi:hypothetical protein